MVIRLWIVSLLIAIGFFVMISGCQSGGNKTTQNYDEWMKPRCGRCHDQGEFSTLLEKTKTMTRDEFANLLPVMIHGDLKMSESEIKDTLDYLEAHGLLKKNEPPKNTK
jgi:hypothetical protein